MIEFPFKGEELWNRMERAVERVNERLRKTVTILENAKVPYAVVGGHAVRAWVAQVDEAAVRTTRDVDTLVRPHDLPHLVQAMTEAGFHHRENAGLNMFVEDPDGSARDAANVVLTGEIVKPNDFDPNPDIEPMTRANNFQTITLEALVRMKLNSTSSQRFIGRSQRLSPAIHVGPAVLSRTLSSEFHRRLVSLRTG